MKHISLEEKNKLEKIYQDFLNNPLIIRMQKIHMHRGSNAYVHSFRVAKLAIKRAIRKKKNLDLESLLIAAILHDYYLYDWRDNKALRKKHARRHPFIAASNAKRDFNVSDFVCDIIKSHMWPINFKFFQKTTEARIVGNADNTIATKEAFTSIKYKTKRMDKYMEYIKTLF